MSRPDGRNDAYPGRPRLLVIAWTRISARQLDLSSILAGEPAIISLRVRPTLVRYLVSAWPTWRLVRSLTCGDVCVVTAPPVLVPAIALLAARRGVTVVMDSHPGAFGRMGDRLSRSLSPLHRWCIRRAGLVLVTTESLASEVSAVGGEPMIFHEPPAASIEEVAEGVGVLFPGTFARDESIGLLLDAADRLPHVPFRATGDLRSAPATRPPNMHFTGWLSQSDFAREMRTAAIVLVLSTEPDSVMRTAYEATRMKRPLVVTDTEATREFFPYAWHVENDADAIAEAIRTIQESPPSWILARVRRAAAHERETTLQQSNALCGAIDQLRRRAT